MSAVPRIAIPASIQEEKVTQPQMQQGDPANLAYTLLQQRGSTRGSVEGDRTEAEEKRQAQQASTL